MFDTPPSQAPGGYDQAPGHRSSEIPPGYESPGGILDQGPSQSQPDGPDPWATGVIHPGAGGAAGMASATSVGDGSIQVSVDDGDYSFLPGTHITVGRDPSCIVTLDERHSLVSRQHLDIVYRDDCWWIEDHSSKGTYIDGKRISKPYRAEGAFLVQLGDLSAGTPMRVITSGEHRTAGPPRALILAAIAVLSLIALVAVFFALRGGDGAETDVDTTDATDATDQIENGLGAPGDSPTGGLAQTSNEATDLAAAKQATVMLLSLDGNHGSGFLVADDLIITNQHVAVLDETLFVAVSRQADDPAEVEFRAQILALHPYLDIAVMEITADAQGAPVDGTGISPAQVGDSGALTLGDPVYNTGFPANLSLVTRDDMGDLLLPPVSATSGEAASFSIWPGCSNPARLEFIPLGSPPGVGCAPEGDVDRGIVITTFSSGQGASGSPVFRGDAVIAVVFAGPEDEANAGRNITTASFRTWLDEVLTQHA
jgi:hypothetical protein